MKIYTRTGDKGETGLFGGARVSKDAVRIDAYGSVDELNAIVGLARALRPHKTVDLILQQVQNELFVLGADLATPHSGKKSAIPRIDSSHVTSLEKNIDALEISLPSLKAFILPGGTPLAAHFHLARTVCRRAERSVVRLARLEKIGESTIVYLNRLSDLFFVLARYTNRMSKRRETQWVNPVSKR